MAYTGRTHTSSLSTANQRMYSGERVTLDDDIFNLVAELYLLKKEELSQDDRAFVKSLWDNPSERVPHKWNQRVFTLHHSVFHPKLEKPHVSHQGLSRTNTTLDDPHPRRRPVRRALVYSQRQARRWLVL